MVKFELATMKYDNGSSLNDNPWTQEILKRFNAKINYMWAVPQPEYEKKITLSIASGELPDIFAVTPKQFYELAKAGAIEDLTSVYEQHAPDSLKKLVNDAGANVLKSATVDGKMMALPFTGLQKEEIDFLWIREDWRKKLGLPEPKTFEDMFTIMNAFANQDPDGNGQKDTYAMGLQKNSLANDTTEYDSMTRGLMNAFHAYKDIWIKDDSGKLVYSNIQPEMKAFLGKLQEMYKNGYLDKEYMVKDSNKEWELYGSNKIGMMFCNWGCGLWPLQMTLTPDVEWKAYEVPSVDGQPSKSALKLNVEGMYWVVKKGFAHPEALFQMADLFTNVFYYNKEPAVDQQLVQNDSNTLIWSMAPVRIYDTLAWNNHGISVRKALNGELNTSELTAVELGQYDNVKAYQGGDKAQWHINAQSGLDGSLSILNKYITDNRYVVDEFYGERLQIMKDKRDTLNRLQHETFTKIVNDEVSIDEFDTFVSEWKRLGGDQITAEINDWYARQ